VINFDGKHVNKVRYNLRHTFVITSLLCKTLWYVCTIVSTGNSICILKAYNLMLNSFIVFEEKKICDVVCMYVRTYVRIMYLCMYACMYVCMHACVLASMLVRFTD
jgi:hypothetical protein